MSENKKDEDMDRPYSITDATRSILLQYAGILNVLPCDPAPDFGRDHLLWMCETAAEHADEWPIDKTSRWLGYVQGVMSMKGLLDVRQERDRTRPLFHRAYENEGLTRPETLERKERRA